MKINPPSSPKSTQKRGADTTATPSNVAAFYERMAAFLKSIKPPIDAAALHAAAHAAARTSSLDEAAAAGAAWQDIRHTLTPIYTPFGVGITSIQDAPDHTPPGEGGPA